MQNLHRLCEDAFVNIFPSRQRQREVRNYLLSPLHRTKSSSLWLFSFSTHLLTQRLWNTIWVDFFSVYFFNLPSHTLVSVRASASATSMKPFISMKKRRDCRAKSPRSAGQRCHGRSAQAKYQMRPHRTGKYTGRYPSLCTRIATCGNSQSIKRGLRPNV